MQGDNRIPGSSNNRTVLGDLTNRRLKRAASLIWVDSDLKSRDDFRKNVEGEPKTVKQVDTEHRAIAFKQVSGVVPAAISGLEDGSSSPNLIDNKFILEKDDAQRVVEEGNESSDAVSTRSGSRRFDKQRMSREFVENDVAEEGLEAQSHKNSEKNVVGNQCLPGKSGSFECSRLPFSEGCKLPGLERQMTDSNAGNELHRGCSSSFCSKAAYIWSDLHYRDLKGRITALEKGRKKAMILKQKMSSNNRKQLDVDLSARWITLFERMEDMFSREGNHLEASFEKLEEVREKCKRKLGGGMEETA